MKIKNLFATPKKAAISTSCIVLALGGITVGSVAVTGAVAEHNSIGQIAAENAALTDAGVKLADAAIYRTEFDFENGQYVYEVEFTANGTEYDYRVAASDGKILARDTEPMDGYNAGAQKSQTAVQGEVAASENMKNKPADKTDVKTQNETVDAAGTATQETVQNGAVTAAGAATEQTAQNGAVDAASAATQDMDDQAESASAAAAAQIGLEDAKTKALADAGKAASDVTFTKERADWDDGAAVYDIEFYTADMEYEYEINAVTGEVRSKSTDTFQGGNKTSDAGKQGGTASTGTAGNNGSYISVDEAKSIAASHAGLALSDIVFQKAKLENDDGRAEYEVEFYKGTMEYDYTIDAANGTILEYDSEYND